MTVTELPAAPAAAAVRLPGHISQSTAIEQARAVAEVQAAVVVAQQVPRDAERALADMRDSCGRLALANRAFYSVPNRGNGPSVHLARELARIWGNLDYGVKELRRDDDAGESEVLAFAWDQQTNVRSMRSFIVPHERMKNGARQKLVDLGDIYLSNQNVGARAVRECIFTVLPTWFTEEAQDRCRTTLEQGDGKPLPDRIADMVAAFDKIGVTVGQLEQKIGRARRGWAAQDVAQMAVAYTDITRDHVPIEELFQPPRVTASEIESQLGSAATADSSTGVAPVAPVEDQPSGDAPSSPDGATEPRCPGCDGTPVCDPTACRGAIEVDPTQGGQAD